jgi:eukaryotic-like serine/threonine-protein kinase
MKNPVHWQQIEDLFHAALERSPHERLAFLSQACTSDISLLAELTTLLAAHEQANASNSDLPRTMIQHAARQLLSEAPLGLDCGQMLSHYQIVSLLGKGGMGEVYLAEDTRLGRRVALKFLPATFINNTERLYRFEQEARATAALNHPNIVTIHEIGQHENLHFIVMEYVQGQTLRQLISNRPLTIDCALEFARQIITALIAAHEAGIIHRDLKPENIMIRLDGLVKVLDFGLAEVITFTTAEDNQPQSAATRAEWIIGTVSYMSPEQARGLLLDARTDIFNLGIMLYEMIAGQPPFPGVTPSELITTLLTTEPVPLTQVAPGISDALQHFVNRILRKNPADRYQSCQELLRDLSDVKQQYERFWQSEKSTPDAPLLTGLDQSSTRWWIKTPFTYPLNLPWRATVSLMLWIVLVTSSFLSLPGHPPVLTAKDVVLLSDIVNTTGDNIFDLTLKRALTVQLEQSPFLRLISDSEVRETLRFMGRAPDERITGSIARDIAYRRGIKAILTGSIAINGNNYVIKIETINSQDGAVIAREQVEARNKAEILQTVSQAASHLRRKLGESLSSIQRFNIPLEQATTSSLAAFQQFALGYELHQRENLVKARPFYQRAVELDHNFALAYARLAAIDNSLEQPVRARAMAEKAYFLRNRVSERERFILTFRYFDSVTNEIEKAIEVLEKWQSVYPRDYLPASNLAARYNHLGMYEQSVAAANEALRRNPAAVGTHVNLGRAFLQLNRFAESQMSYEQALKQNPDLSNAQLGLYILALINQDTVTSKRLESWAIGRPEELEVIEWQAAAALYAGRFQEGRSYLQRGIALARRQKSLSALVRLRLNLAWAEANFGSCAAAKREIAQGLALDGDGAALFRARILAMCGETRLAKTLVNEVLTKDSADTLVKNIWLPVTQATIALQLNAPEQVLRLLRDTKQLEGAARFWPAYLRAQAYLRLKATAEARVEFQGILDRRGYDPHSLLYVLSQLGLARTEALAGDRDKSRQAYQDLFSLWQGADANLPVLKAARKEYQKIVVP